jgi:glucose/arabinose dehydrogenase
MRIRSLAAVVSVTLVVGLAGPASGRPSSRTTPRVPTISAQTVVSGLNYPAAFTFAPDGRIFYGERFTGDIRIYNPSTHSNTLFFHIPSVVTNGEQGLLGVALHPQYADGKPFVYAYATRKAPDQTLHNQILRIRDTGGTGSSAKVIFSNPTTAGTYHDGGRILFGPDRKLYVVVGEGHDPSNAQDLTNSAGKSLRMTWDGKVPADNPIPGSLIWTYGLRNSYGFAFDPETGRLWETENGPECNDEVNLLHMGHNYGWGPNENCADPNPPANTNQDGPDPVMPLAWFTPTIAPVGTVFCEGCGLGAAYEGTLLFASYNDHEIRRVYLTADRKDISSLAKVFNTSGAPLSMEAGPDGSVYFSSEDGSIYKLVP